MTQTQFIAKCNELTIDYSIALENQLIRDTLAKAIFNPCFDALVIELLQTQF
jgi:hypothetical protein